MSLFDELILHNIAKYCTSYEVQGLIVLSGYNPEIMYFEQDQSYLLNSKKYYEIFGSIYMFHVFKTRIKADKIFELSKKWNFRNLARRSDSYTLCKNIAGSDPKYLYRFYQRNKHHDPYTKMDENDIGALENSPKYMTKIMVCALRSARPCHNQSPKTTDKIMQIVHKSPKWTYIFYKFWRFNLNDEAFNVIIRNPKRAAKYFKHFETTSDKVQKIRNIIIDYPELCKRHINYVAERWPELEKKYIDNPDVSTEYARRVLKARWPEAEGYILRSCNPKLIMNYIRDVVKDRWSEAEDYLIESSKYACEYATCVLKSRWPEAEPIIFGNPEDTFRYISNLPNEKIPSDLIEPIIFTSRDIGKKYTAKFITTFEDFKRIPKVDPKIIGTFIKNSRRPNRHSEIENVLLKSQKWAVVYAIKCIGERWPELEKILVSPKRIYKYCSMLSKDIPDLEHHLLRSVKYATKYYTNVAKRRAPSIIERRILRDTVFSSIYLDKFLN